MKFYQTNPEAICKKLDTNCQTGLSPYQAKIRLEKYGPNRIKEEKRKSTLLIFFQQFLNPLIYILLIAAVVSFLIGEKKDAIVIAIAVIINTIIGFIQELRAEKAASALKAYAVAFCSVRRNGKVEQIKTQELVPGDIVLLTAGSRVSADVRLFYAVDFTIEEAILTGESHAIEKSEKILTEELSLGDRTNMAFSGTYAISGKAEGIVVATGDKTELGKIAQLIVETKEEKTPLQKQISRFSWLLGWLMLGLTIFVFLLGLIKQIPFKEILITSIALAVAAIPEGLLIAVTIVLAIGMQRMLKREALVRHLIAAETLGSVSVICTDKTGTLTEGRMGVEELWAKDESQLWLAATLNNDAQISEEEKKRIGNPTEVAVLEAATKSGIKIEKENFVRIDEIPFSSDLKYMATLHSCNRSSRHKNLLIVKGAPEKVLSMCAVKPDELEAFEDKAKEMANKGLRLLAFASKKTDNKKIKGELKKLSLVGLVGLQDPLRPTAKQTVDELSQAGIHTVVVTGDHQDTATNIARGAGIYVDKHNVMTGETLNKLSDEELYNKITEVELFARVDPKHKIRIVDAWRRRGESVAMIGDGVNDAPALKSADIGVALGSGSDVAQEISDMVLLDNNLSTISAAVKEGRTIFDNIRKVIVYLMADSFSEIVLIVGSLLMGLPLPLLASQIFWINLVTDGFPDIALTMEPPEDDIMLRAPRKKTESVMNKEMITIIFIIGIVTDIIQFSLYFYLLRTSMSIKYIRTIMFTAMAINSLVYVFSVRSMRSSLFRMNPFKNMWLNIAVLAGLCTQLAAVYIPPMQKLFSTVAIGATEWGIILVLALIKITGIEITKEWFLRRR